MHDPFYPMLNVCHRTYPISYIYPQPAYSWGLTITNLCLCEVLLLTLIKPTLSISNHYVEIQIFPPASLSLTANFGLTSTQIPANFIYFKSSLTLTPIFPQRLQNHGNPIFFNTKIINYHGIKRFTPSWTLSSPLLCWSNPTTPFIWTSDINTLTGNRQIQPTKVSGKAKCFSYLFVTAFRTVLLFMRFPLLNNEQTDPHIWHFITFSTSLNTMIVDRCNGIQILMSLLPKYYRQPLV